MSTPEVFLSKKFIELCAANGLFATIACHWNQTFTSTQIVGSMWLYAADCVLRADARLIAALGNMKPTQSKDIRSHLSFLSSQAFAPKFWLAHVG